MYLREVCGSSLYSFIASQRKRGYWLTTVTERKSSAPIAANEEDLFDIALDNETKPSHSKSTSDNPKSPNSYTARTTNSKHDSKRQKKDAKFGFGGKKRFAKSGDAQSTADMSGFSARKMKGKGSKRLGKSRRAKVG